MSDLRQAVVAPRSLLHSRLGQVSKAVRRPIVAWGTRDRKTRIVFWLLVALSTLLALVIDAAIIGELLSDGRAYVNKLFLFWTWSKVIHVISPAALVYDPHALYALERGIISRHAHYLPFAYPPSMLLLIWPLALVRPAIALLVWLGVSLVAYIWACWRRPWGPLITTLALVSPSTLAGLYYGQLSLLVAALIIGGCRLVDRRPIVAGILFGLATVKPQFGLLVPVALISAKQWRTVIAASVTVGSTVIASGVAFGWAAWTQLPVALTDLSRFVVQYPGFVNLCPTVTSAVRGLGGGPVTADAAQLVAAAYTIATIWICSRHGMTLLSAAAVMVGAFLVTPYALFYDLPMVSYAVLAVVIERHESGEPFGTAELLILIASIALPLLIIFNPHRAPWGIFVLPMLFFVIIRRIAVKNRTAECYSVGPALSNPSVGRLPDLDRPIPNDTVSLYRRTTL